MKIKKTWKTFSGLGATSVVVSAISIMPCINIPMKSKNNDVMSNASQNQGMSNASQNQGMSNASQNQGMSNASQSLAMSNASQSQAMSNASQSLAMSNASQSQAMSNASQSQAMSNASQSQAMSNNANALPTTIGLNDYKLGLLELQKPAYKNWITTAYRLLDPDYGKDHDLDGEEQVDWLNTYAQMHPQTENFGLDSLSWINYNLDPHNCTGARYMHIQPAINKIFHESYLLGYNDVGNLTVQGYTTYIPVRISLHTIVQYGSDGGFDPAFDEHDSLGQWGTWSDDVDIAITHNCETGEETYDIRPPSSFYTQHPVAQEWFVNPDIPISKNRYTEYQGHAYTSYDVSNVRHNNYVAPDIHLGSLINGPLNYLQNKPLPNDSRLAFRHLWSDNAINDQDDNDLNSYQKISAADLENGLAVNPAANLAYNHPAFVPSSKIIVTDSWNLNNPLKPQLTDFAVDSALYSIDSQSGKLSPDEDFDWLYSPVKHTETMELSIGNWASGTSSGTNTDFYQRITTAIYGTSHINYLSYLLMIASHGQLFSEEIL